MVQSNRNNGKLSPPPIHHPQLRRQFKHRHLWRKQNRLNLPHSRFWMLLLLQRCRRVVLKHPLHTATISQCLDLSCNRCLPSIEARFAAPSTKRCCTRVIVRNSRNGSHWRTLDAITSPQPFTPRLLSTLHALKHSNKLVSVCLPQRMHEICVCSRYIQLHTIKNEKLDQLI